MTSCRGISNVGSHPLIRGKITTSPTDRGTAEPGSGSFKGTRSLNGRNQERALFYGSMANVSCRPCGHSFVEADGLPFLAGSGKSVLWYVNLRTFSFRELRISTSSTIIEVIETLCKSGLASLAIFYYDFREDQKKDLHGLLSSLLFQLCDQSDSYHDVLSIFYSSHRNGAKSPSDTELYRCLKDLLELPGQAPVYLIIDALDECPSTSAMPSPREELLKLVVQLVELRLPNLRICVTSRPETDIKAVLEPLTFRAVSIHDESGQMEDIERYIRSVINTDPRNRRWKQEDKELVIDILKERTDGM